MTGILHIVVARKPIEGTIAENCLKYGCGAINIDECRVATGDSTARRWVQGNVHSMSAWRRKENRSDSPPIIPDVTGGSIDGRWPANLILDESIGEKNFPNTVSQKGVIKRAGGFARKMEGRLDRPKDIPDGSGFGDSGSASRFFFSFIEQESEE